MDSGLQPQAAASNTPNSDASPIANEKQTQAPVITGGFSSFSLELGAAILECVNLAGHLDTEVKGIIHVPKAREHIITGFEILASLHGGLFALLGNQLNYELDSFYDACSEHRKVQRALAERTEIARLAGMSLAEFDLKAKNLTNPK